MKVLEFVRAFELCPWARCFFDKSQASAYMARTSQLSAAWRLCRSEVTLNKIKKILIRMHAQSNDPFSVERLKTEVKACVFDRKRLPKWQMVDPYLVDSINSSLLWCLGTVTEWVARIPFRFYIQAFESSKKTGKNQEEKQEDHHHGYSQPGPERAW